MGGETKLTTATLEAPAKSTAEILGPLDEPGFRFTATGLDISDSVSFDAWQRYGRKLQLAEKGIQWALGDWIIFGEDSFKERAYQAVDFCGLKLKTLQNYATVAKALKKSRRRDFDRIDYSTQAEVAPLDEDDQERVLEQAETEQLTRKQVRRVVSKIKREQGKEKSDVEIIHTPQVQEFLQRYIDVLKGFEESVPVTALFLRQMFQNHLYQAHWQKTRTIVEDAEVMGIAIDEYEGQIGEDDLFTWLQVRGYYMSDPEFDATLDYMERDDVRLAKRTDAGHGKQDDRRGKLPIIIKRWFNDFKHLNIKNREDDEDAA